MPEKFSELSAEKEPSEIGVRKIQKDSYERKNQFKKYAGGKEANKYH